MGTNVIMPQLGESVVEGKVSRWLKQIGEAVKLYEPILEVETDKVTTEVTAAGEGTLLKLYANEGDVVKAGTLIAFIGEPDEAIDEPSHVTEHASTASKIEQRGNGSSARISPVVARIASEHHIDLALVHGTGEGGRVTKKDILAFVAQYDSPRPMGEGQGVRVEPEKLEAWEQPGLGEPLPADGRSVRHYRVGLAWPDRSGDCFRANGYVR